MTKKATLIVGHGSRYEYNKKIMELQKERLEKMGFENVYIGFNETSHPFIGETMEQMAADGIEEVVAIPFFIASGLHMTRDIPPKLGLKDDCKDMVVSVDGHEMMMHFGEPFGEDPLLAKILGEKIDEAKKCKRTGVLVIGHGSKLHYNKDIISLNAKRLTDMGYDDVLYAFNEFNEPTIEDVLEELLSRGVDEVLVLPLFISLGDHLKNDIPPKIHLVDGVNDDTYDYNGKKVRICYLSPSGDDPRLTDLFAEKVKKYL